MGVWETFGGGEAWEEPIQGRPPWRTARAVQQRCSKRFGSRRLPSSPLCLNLPLPSPRWRRCAQSTAVTDSVSRKPPVFYMSQTDWRFYCVSGITSLPLAIINIWSVLQDPRVSKVSECIIWYSVPAFLGVACKYHYCCKKTPYITSILMDLMGIVLVY